MPEKSRYFTPGRSYDFQLKIKGEDYTQYIFKCVREDISNPTEITYTTSSKRLIEEMVDNAPVKGKTLKIVKSGTGFQTKYNVVE